MRSKSLWNYLILWAGQFLSSLGSSMTGFAITIWAYNETGSALALSLSGIALMVPKMIGGLLAGPIVERLSKKRVMLVTDIGAGLCTVAMLVLFTTGRLVLWHIYLLNVLTSLLGSFQSPAASVAVSLVVPKDQYTRAGGLDAFKNGTVQMLSPVLAAALLGLFGMGGVFAVDLFTLVLACVTLATLVKIPKTEAEGTKSPLRLRGYFAEMKDGFRTLRSRPLLMTMLTFFAFINLAAGISYYSLLSPMVLARTGQDAGALALVNGAMGAGGIVGGLLVAALPAPRRKVPVVFGAALLSFVLGDLMFGLGRVPVMWAVGGFLSSLLLPFLDANEMYLWRTGVPVSHQGRAFSFKYAFQAGWIPVGMLLGGFMADHVFEPMMAEHGPGSGMAVMFLITGVCGVGFSLLGLSSKRLRRLEAEQGEDRV